MTPVERVELPLLLIVGPTASGKSAVAEALSTRIDAELVSADAFQVYRGLDIGTAKPDAASRHRYRYHCLDTMPPDSRCTAGKFARRARQAIESIRARGRWPLLVGGSGFYIDAVVNGLDPVPPSEPRWHAALEAVVGRRKPGWPYAALERLDAARVAEIGPHDTRRLVRALEVVMRSGRTHDRQREATGEPAGGGLEPLREPCRWFGISRPRDNLETRIRDRIQRMLAAGWLDEVQGLLEAGLPQHAHALQALGYRQLVAVCRGRMRLDDAVEEIGTSTRRYAKRQMTWFRRVPQIEWIEAASGHDGRGDAAVVDEIRERIGAGAPC